MRRHLKQGWRMTLWNPFLILFLFGYQLLWGYVLLRLVRSVVVPMLHRYPGEDLPETIRQLFWAESQFRLLKTDVAMPYVWIILGLLLARMIATPFIHAGVYHRIHQTHCDLPRSFAKGVRQSWAGFAILQIAQTLLAGLPLFWIAPRLLDALLPLTAPADYGAWLPYIIGYSLYTGIIRILFTYGGFALITRAWNRLPAILAKKALPVCGISACIAGFALLVHLAGWASAVLYAGFLAVALHQLQYLLQAVLRLWEIGAHHSVWVNEDNRGRQPS